MESEPIIFQGALAISFRECRLYSVDGDEKKLVTIIALHNLTYPSWGKGKSSPQTCRLVGGYVIVPRRVPSRKVLAGTLKCCFFQKLSKRMLVLVSRFTENIYASVVCKDLGLRL